MVIVFAATLSLGAFLLFVLQPLFGKLVLPLLGGVPSVWSTCLVFFQGTLLAGYVYAHLVSSRLTLRRQAAVHLALVLLPMAVLPLGVPDGWEPPVEGGQVAWLAALLAVTVGLPFFTVSTTAPLLQRWFSRTTHTAARDPYFLYAASNAGSLAGLVAYPLAIEPWLSRAAQATSWAAGYVLLVGLVAACARIALRENAVAPQGVPSADEDVGRERPRPLDRARWFVLSAVPASLLLGVTTYITTDLGSFPLLWVVPLALYLTTFINAFATRPLLGPRQTSAILPLVVIPAVLTFVMGSGHVGTIWIPAHLAAFTVAAAVSHGWLAQHRPSRAWLTEYFVWISAGGLAGGLVNALLAPALLTGAYEYPAMLTAACFLRSDFRVSDLFRSGVRSEQTIVSWNRWPSRLVLDVLALAPGPAFLVLRGVASLANWSVVASNVVSLGPPLLACAMFAPRRIRFGLAVGSIVAAGLLWPAGGGAVLHAERDFFGVIRVMESPSGRVHRLVHGTTIHGMQVMDADHRGEPTAYYHREGPLGDVFATPTGRSASARIAVVGLGTGATACHGHPLQDWTFFEIDPAVVRIAQNRRLFTYLHECRPSVRIVVGDARRSLAREPDGTYDMVILDAFGSDSIPIHLLTLEAIELYRRKLAPMGMIVAHVSNRHFDLEPVLAAAADRLGMESRCRSESPPPNPDGRLPSTWCALAPAAAAFGVSFVPADRLPDSRRSLWTDDHASVLDVVKWTAR